MNNPVEKALKEMQQKLHLAGYQLQVVYQYMGYVYGIGFDDGESVIAEKHFKPIIQLDRFGKELERFPSIKHAAKAMGIPGTNISKVLNGKKLTCKGFKWKYA